MDSNLNLLDDSFNLRDLVDVSETSWVVTELLMDVTKAEETVASTPILNHIFDILNIDAFDEEMSSEVNDVTCKREFFKETIRQLWG